MTCHRSSRPWVRRSGRSYAQLVSPGSVHSTLMVAVAVFRTISGSPLRLSLSGASASSPESDLISFATSAAAIFVPVGSTKPTAFRSPERQPSRKASTLRCGPSSPEQATRVAEASRQAATGD